MTTESLLSKRQLLQCLVALSGSTVLPAHGPTRHTAGQAARQFGFGQPVGGLCQLAFVVEDVHVAMKNWTRNLNAGPWFLSDPLNIDVMFRGEPDKFNITIANGNAGHLQIELIQQNDKAPTVYTEIVELRGYGIHHIGIATRDFAGTLDRYLKFGYEIVARMESNIVQAAYLDSKGGFPVFLEVMGINSAIEAQFTAMYHASIGWKGEDPVRRMP